MMARKPKTDSATRKATDTPASDQDLWNEHKILAGRVNMLQWVVGFGFGLYLVTLAIFAQLAVNNINVNDALRADLNDLRVEFEIYKSQNPQ